VNNYIHQKIKECTLGVTGMEYGKDEGEKRKKESNSKRKVVSSQLDIRPGPLSFMQPLTQFMIKASRLPPISF
jgi:hypothetical protein